MKHFRRGDFGNLENGLGHDRHWPPRASRLRGEERGFSRLPTGAWGWVFFGDDGMRGHRRIRRERFAVNPAKTHRTVMKEENGGFGGTHEQQRCTGLCRGTVKSGTAFATL